MNCQKQIRVAMLGKGYINWGGGIDFLKYYINGLYNNENNIDLILFLPKEEGCISFLKSILRPYKRCIVNFINKKTISLKREPNINLDKIKENFLSEFPQLKIIEYRDNKNFLIKILQKEQIDIIFPSLESLGNDFPIPWVGYIYDFQHKYYPEFFTKQECKIRDKDFKRIVSTAKAIIVAAEQVKNDINKYYPDNKCNIYVMPFKPIARSEWLKNNIDISKYRLPKKYFLISNQFWIHKNHKTAFKALSLLNSIKGFEDIHIVCTGNMYDSRDPNYLNELNLLIEGLGIKNNIHLLGYIPKLDQIEILKQSIGLIQPTLFEGGPGGGSTAEALSLGKKVVLSNIPVNKEIKNDSVYFFEAKSEIDLKNKLIEVLNESNTNSNLDLVPIESNRQIVKDEIRNYIINIINKELFRVV